jgi:tetratricopeptide (TPR) repeat protein
MSGDRDSGPGAAGKRAKIVAFASPVSGTGRTSVVVNVAWILSGAGKRVLVVDWGTELPLVHHYLQPFHVQTGAVAQVLGDDLDRLLFRYAGPGRADTAVPALAVRRYALPAGAGAFDVAGLGEPGAAVQPGVPAPESLGEIALLRERLCATGYDYVLIDSPTDRSDPAVTQTALLCDTVAVCFPQPRTAIWEAARIAGRIRRAAPVRIRLIAVPTRFDVADDQIVRQSRSAVHDAFSDPSASDPSGTSAGAVETVEVPYRPVQAYGEVLAALVDEPGRPASMLTAYERLAAAITEGEVTRLPPVPRLFRSHYRIGLSIDPAGRRTEPAGPDDVIALRYAAEDRPWADWIHYQLARAGARVHRLPDVAGQPGSPDRAHLVVISSSHLAARKAGGTAHPAGSETAGTASPAGSKAGGTAHPAGAETAGTASPPGAETAGTATLWVRVEPANGPGATEPPESASQIDLCGRGEESARQLLYAYFALIEPVQPVLSDRMAPRFPGTARPPKVFGVSPRNRGFVGRSEDLATVRDRLSSADHARPYLLTGPVGVGKSEIAREYAHRFGYDYDAVWWVPAHDRESVRASLARLGDAIGVRHAGDVVGAVLEELTSGRTRRWLLVYDNADEPGVLTDLVPTGGPGHVLITTRGAGPEAAAGGDPLARSEITASATPPAARVGSATPPAARVGSATPPAARVGSAGAETDRAPTPVALFSPDESVAMLQRHLPDLLAPDAAKVAAALDRLPLALRLAASWMRENTALRLGQGLPLLDAVAVSAGELLEHVEQIPARRAAGPADSMLHGAERALAVCVAALSTTRLGRATLRLAELCAFLSPEGVDLRLVRSRPMLEQLLLAAGDDGATIARDPVEFDRLLWTGSRFALFDVDWGSAGSVRMHRAVQSLVRESLAPPAREARRSQVLRALAGYCPTDAEEEGPRRRDVLAELQKHLLYSGALEAAEPAVRRWVLSQIRYLSLEGDATTWLHALDLTRRLRQDWSALDGAEDDLLRLAGLAADLHRSLGEQERAQELDEEALSRQRRSLGLGHLRTLISARGRGGDLRGLGEFPDALIEDQATWEGFRQALGDDHPQTLRASHNLALSSFLMGDVREALRQEQDVLDRRTRLFGPDDPLTWWSACDVGTYLRELGREREAREKLADVRDRIRDLGHENQLSMMRVLRGLAVVERRLGHAADAKARDAEALRLYRDVLGREHPGTWGCQLSLALDHQALGDTAPAVELAGECLYYFGRRLSVSHPFVAVCRMDLAMCLRAFRQVDSARAAGEQALRDLTSRLDTTHPWTVAAALNQAGNLVAAGDVRDAQRLAEAALAICREYLGPGHPYTSVAEGNTAAIRGPVQAGVWRDIDIDIPQT